jgi:MSHA biogenesis protein MshO
MTMSIPPVRKDSHQRGFTLVEAIVVMVITGILSGIMVLFIRRPVQNYVDTAARAEMSESAELALRRMTRELHTALPNSIRVTAIGNVSLLELIPTKAGGLYLDSSDGASAPNVPLSFGITGLFNFTVVGPMPPAPYAIAPGDFIVVYNLGTGFTGNDAYANSNIATVTLVNNNLVTVNSVNGFTGSGSPGHRFQVAGQPVTFVCVSNPATGRGTLTRIWNYGLQANQIDPTTLVGSAAAPGARAALMANNVLGCQFNYNQAANQQSALVGLVIALARPAPGAAANGLETVTLSHQVHVDNTP